MKFLLSGKRPQSTRTYCLCGRVKNKHLSECSACAKAKRERILAAARKIVAGGICSSCGGALRRNNSLSGWWQCEQLGAEGFRKDSARPSCNFQIFTE